MSPSYDPPRREPSGPDDLVGVIVLGSCLILAAFWFIAVSRLRMTNAECLEAFLYVAITLFGTALLISHFVGRTQKREDQ